MNDITADSESGIGRLECAISCWDFLPESLEMGEGCWMPEEGCWVLREPVL